MGFLKICGKVALATLDVLTGDDNDKPIQHISEDDGVSDNTYTDGLGDEYERGWSGQLENSFGLTPDDGD